MDKKDLEKKISELTDERLERVEDKTDKILDRISSIDVTLGEQHKQLEHHIYRTGLNEDRIRTIENKLVPLVEQKNKIEGVLKFVGILASIAGIGKLILEIIQL